MVNDSHFIHSHIFIVDNLGIILRNDFLFHTLKPGILDWLLNYFCRNNPKPCAKSAQRKVSQKSKQLAPDTEIY